MMTQKKQAVDVMNREPLCKYYVSMTQLQVAHKHREAVIKWDQEQL